MGNVYLISVGGSPIDLIDLLFPVGEVKFLNSTTDPNTLYPGTTWERIKGKVLVGLDEDDEDFNELDKTGGEKDHLLTVDELPSHNHGFLNGSYTFSWGQTSCNVKVPSADVYTGAPTTNCLGTHQFATSKQSHNNLQPYQVVYVWQRVS